MKIKKFKNIPKVYQSPDESFIARGVHLNKIVEYLTICGGIKEGINDMILGDNAATPIIIGDLRQDRSIHIVYTIVRGSSYQEGILRILNDGVNVFIIDDYQDNTISSGVVFTVDIFGNDIRLIATLTSTGNSAIFKAQVKGIMI